MKAAGFPTAIGDRTMSEDSGSVRQEFHPPRFAIFCIANKSVPIVSVGLSGNNVAGER